MCAAVTVQSPSNVFEFLSQSDPKWLIIVEYEASNTSDKEMASNSDSENLVAIRKSRRRRSTEIYRRGLVLESSESSDEEFEDYRLLTRF